MVYDLVRYGLGQGSVVDVADQLHLLRNRCDPWTLEG